MTITSSTSRSNKASSKSKKALLCCLLAVVAVMPLARLMSDKPFTHNAWVTAGRDITGPEIEPYPGNFERIKMVEDLRAHYLRPGMDRESVRALLGPESVVDNTGEKGPIDLYTLVDRPLSFNLWQTSVWMRYQMAAPTLRLEYDRTNLRLVSISVN